MKMCKACSQEKPLDQFHKDRSKADGLNAYCKPCTIARQQKFAKRPPRRKDPEGMKTCQRCKEAKPVAAYCNLAGTWDGLDKICRPCRSAAHDTWRRGNLGKVAADARRRRAESPDRYADYILKRHYGLGPGDYDRMLKEQGGRCAICKTDDTGRHRRFHVDHCHDTGVVRALLCHNCNVGIGHFFHRTDLLLEAVAYISASTRK